MTWIRRVPVGDVIVATAGFVVAAALFDDMRVAPFALVVAVATWWPPDCCSV